MRVLVGHTRAWKRFYLSLLFFFSRVKWLIHHSNAMIHNKVSVREICMRIEKRKSWFEKVPFFWGGREISPALNDFFVLGCVMFSNLHFVFISQYPLEKIFSFCWIFNSKDFEINLHNNYKKDQMKFFFVFIFLCLFGSRFFSFGNIAGVRMKVDMMMLGWFCKQKGGFLLYKTSSGMGIYLKGELKREKVVHAE